MRSKDVSDGDSPLEIGLADFYILDALIVTQSKLTKPRRTCAPTTKASAR